MSERQPRITKNGQLPTDCPVMKMTGKEGTVFLGSLTREKAYFIEKPDKRLSPTGPRCRLNLLKRAAEAGIEVDFTSSCSWCGTNFTEEKID